MRDIKFRAWINDRELGLFNYALNRNGALLPCIESMVIEQYTGLKDKNGKEIYEGDIVRESAAMGDEVGIITWHDSGAIGWSIRTKDNSRFLISTNTHEIIGNVHSNPELLN